MARTDVNFSASRFGLLVICTVFVMTSSASDCPEKCACDSEFTVIDCSHQDLTLVPRDIPLTTTNLNLEGNQLSFLNSSDFENLESLTDLILSDNNLQSIQNGTFSIQSSLVRLMLDGNLLESVDNETFQGTDNLEVLNMDSNNEMSVAPSTFQSISNLRQLSVQDTTFVSDYDFSGLTKLEMLEISNCHLEQLDPNNFQELNSLTDFYANENNLTDFNFVHNLPNLKKLCMSSNLLTEIQARAFENNQNLTRIILDQNAISTLASESFVGPKQIVLIKLTLNQLETFPEDTFGELNGNESLRVDLEGNDLNCNQDMSWITSFVNKDIFRKATCSSPTCLTGRDITTLASCDFDCDKEVSGGDAMLGLIIALSVVSCLLFSLCALMCVRCIRHGHVQSRYKTLGEVGITSSAPI